MRNKTKQRAPWALSLALGAGLAYAVIGWYGGVVHFVGLKHFVGCETCAKVTLAEVVAVQKAQTAPVGSAQ